MGLVEVVWRFLWTNGVGQNILASAIMFVGGIAIGVAFRHRLGAGVDRWLHSRLAAHHDGLHAKLDQLLDRVDGPLNE